MRILGDTLPKAFLLENVEGLGFRGKDEGVQFISQEIASINRRHGTSYSISKALLNSAEFGVPQTRRRLFIVGSRDGASFSFPRPTHAETPVLGDHNVHRLVTTWDAIWDLDHDDPSLALRGKWAELLPSIPEGQNYLWHTDRGGGEPLFGWRRRYWNFLLKLAKDRPSWTLQAQPGPATGPFHWRNRRLSVSEMARLQTFPNDINITGGLADAQRQLGNAVPSLLAEVLARQIRTQFLNSPLEGELKLAVASAPVDAPPSKIGPIPARYLGLKGDHTAHPGTGGGYRSLRTNAMPVAAE
jgi:DNA (cytosine-5)-methyltransferase 1